ncbi:MAG: methyltransferase domain-containing protein [Verrucomicrobiota bacterium]
MPSHRFNTNDWRRRCYSLGAPVYDLLVRGFRPWRRRSLELLALQPGEKVLLIGAGTGEDLEFLPSGVRVTAIDLTPAMLDRLKKRAVRLNLQVDARVMDGHQLAFPDATFDVVILHLILAVIPDPVRCAREAARVLRPGGRVTILDKFLPDGRPLPLAIRLLAPVIGFFGTEINRQLGPILAGTDLDITRQEPLGMRGFFKIVLARKPSAP